MTEPDHVTDAVEDLKAWLVTWFGRHAAEALPDIDLDELAVDLALWMEQGGNGP
jgi:hypothetical protein